RQSPVAVEDCVSKDMDENVDPTEVKSSVASLQREAGRKDEAMEVQDAFDWTDICRSLETTFNIDGFDNTGVGRRRGATITSVTDKGHLLYECLDDCFRNTKLGDIKGIPFPGAFARKPFENVWSAWRIASIFIRSDLSITEKIRLHNERAVMLETQALCAILRLAYDQCTDWTEFICGNQAIVKHPRIEDHNVEEFYEVAFEKVKEDLKEEAQAARPRKIGPIGFAAPESAILLEKDGPRGGVYTRVVKSFESLRNTLADWTTYGTWIIVLPMERKAEGSTIEETVKIAKTHLEEGGRIVTVWTPVTAKTLAEWISMSQLWSTIDATLRKFAGPDQIVTTASNMLCDGKFFLEAGCPETASQFFRLYPGVAAAKYLYENIRCRVPQFQLPFLETERSMRTSTTARGGVSATARAEERE
ncbi:hypothetical protein V3C99_000035, partial [Haemonchus contortus]